MVTCLIFPKSQRIVLTMNVYQRLPIPNFSMLIFMLVLDVRSGCIYDTVNHIAAPTRPCIRGESKLCGSHLVSYRSKEWIPRIRNTGGKYVIVRCMFVNVHNFTPEIS